MAKRAVEIKKSVGREVEIKKSVGQVIGSLVVENYIKKTGGYAEYQRLRKAVGMAPAPKSRPISRTLKGTVDDDALAEVMREHVELLTEDGPLYTQGFYEAVHRDWMRHTQRGLNQFEISAMVDRLTEWRINSSHGLELDLIDDVVLSYEDLLTEDDWECKEIISVAQKDVESRIHRSLCRGGEIRTKMQAQAFWIKKFDGDPDEQ